jgi:hypothetical protein
LATANLIPEPAAKRIRDYLLEVTEHRYPVVSVSQQPIDFGRNICVGAIGRSKYNEYKQILLGVREVTTEYVATVDDDTLYAPVHFEYRPPPGIFSYETNYWFAQDEKDNYWRIRDIATKGGGMWGCIARTEDLLSNLTARFKNYPTDPWLPDSPVSPPMYWGEPGIEDEEYGLPRESYLRRASPEPCVIFIHRESMGFRQYSRFHRRYGHPTPENRADSLPQFGTMADLRRKFWQGDPDGLPGHAGLHSQAV